MKSVWSIIKKEFARFFKDRRMILSLLLPGLMIYLVYTLIGTVTSSHNKPKDYKPAAYVQNVPVEFAPVLEGVLKIKTEEKTVDEAKAEVAEGEAELFIVFPENFVEDLNEGKCPDIQIYYNSAKEDSNAAYIMISTVFNTYMETSFTLNGSTDVKFDLAKESELAGSILSAIVPMLMFSLLASACIMVASESIAGEKERGTMATMLITPIKRWQLAIGKIVSLSCFAVLSGLSSFIGVILSLPKLMNGIIGANTAAFYSVGDYFMLFGIIISVVLVIISAFSVISAYAKSVKEASSLITPLMMVILIMGMASMFVSTSSVGLYAIPLLGSGLVISSIMTFSISPLGVVLSILSNLVVSVVLIVLLSFMFKSEKIMFNK